MGLTQFQVKLQKIAEITYLQGNKTQRRYRLRHLDVSKEKYVLKTKKGMKDKSYDFRGYKQINNVCLECLECKLQ